ncbi:hypothetical protein IFM89_011780 [Coptis chinensis]|uniref:Protein kinase domain-containing protein n=1 Tax=Coptis chinensis TaxID=261450 RepID=A0A835M8K8_9MAGN|nr:hypothetical protein IFM89_011780 [Coptis chinensis]
MTNITYFYDSIRDDKSVSSSSVETSSQAQPTVAVGGVVARVEVSSIYSVFSKACFACARPSLDQVYDASTTTAAEATSTEDDSNMSLNSVDVIFVSSDLKSFSFAELKTATRNFRPSAAFGCVASVFKGYIDEDTPTATKLGKGIAICVKWLNQEGFQDHTEWSGIANDLRQLCHPNLVKLFGYCLENEKCLLVSEFIPRGSLDNYLFRTSCYPLSWRMRMKVALGAAKGLAFLHSSEMQVIHRDLKTSSILLDLNYNAKLSYYKIHVSTRPTCGYAAPEYIATGNLTAESNVYSFGVVLLEILCGRRTVDNNRPSGEHSLVEWAKPYLNHKHKVFRVLDSRLGGQYSLRSAQKSANLTLQCLAKEPKLRPSMEKVVLELEQLQDSGDIKNTKMKRSQSSSQSRYNYLSLIMYFIAVFFMGESPGSLHWFLAGKTIEEIQKDAAREKKREMIELARAARQKDAATTSSFASTTIFQHQGNSVSQDGLTNDTPHASLLRNIACLDEFKQGFPTTGLATVTMRWWGGRGSDGNEDEIFGEEPAVDEVSKQQPHDLADNDVEFLEEETDPLAKKIDMGPQGAALLSSVRKAATAEGREALKLGVFGDHGLFKPDRQEKLMLLKVFKSSMSCQWKFDSF